jgi:hypothetical protein
MVRINFTSNKNFSPTLIREFNKFFLSIFFIGIYFYVSNNFSLIDYVWFNGFWLLFFLLRLTLFNNFVINKRDYTRDSLPFSEIIFNSLLFLSLIALFNIFSTVLSLSQIVIVFLAYLVLGNLPSKNRFLNRILNTQLIINTFSLLSNYVITFSLIFISLRFWFYFKIPIVGVHPDSGGYFELSQSITNLLSSVLNLNFSELSFPSFKTRGIGYPAFLSAVYFIDDSHLAVALFQSLLSLVAGLILIKSINSYSKPIATVLAPILAFSLSKSQNLLYETSILTESLFLSLVLLFFALLFQLLMRYSKNNAILLSLITASIVLLKPGAFPFLITLIFSSVYIFYSTRNIKVISTLLLPFTIALVIMGLYNRLEYGTFSNTNSGSENLALVTNLMWETNNSYPDSINQAIRKSRNLTSERISDTELDLLINSWDFEKMYPLYLAGHFYGPSGEIGKVTDGYGGSKWNSWISRISIDSMKEHPVYYLKHYLIMMKYNFRLPAFYNSQTTVSNVLERVRIYSFNEHFSPNRKDIDGGTKEFMVALGKEYSNTLYKPGALIIDRESKEVSVNKQLKYLDHYEKYSVMYESMLNSNLWIKFFFICSFFSFFYLIKFKSFIHIFIALISFTVLSSFSIIALVEYSIPRYTYVYEFLYILVPILFLSERFKQNQNKPF